MPVGFSLCLALLDCRICSVLDELSLFGRTVTTLPHDLASKKAGGRGQKEMESKDKRKKGTIGKGVGEGGGARTIKESENEELCCNYRWSLRALTRDQELPLVSSYQWLFRPYTAQLKSTWRLILGHLSCYFPMMADSRETAETLNLLADLQQVCRQNDWQLAFEILEKVMLDYRWFGREWIDLTRKTRFGILLLQNVRYNRDRHGILFMYYWMFNTIQWIWPSSYDVRSCNCSLKKNPGYSVNRWLSNQGA